MKKFLMQLQLLALLMFVSVTVLQGAVLYVNSSGTCSNVPCFSTIQAAINAASPGDIIHVEAGTYHEDVNVNKDVTLQGSGIDQSIISGVPGGDGATVRISASGVTVEGFTITRDGNNPVQWYDPGLNSAGIAIQGLAITAATIQNNKFIGNRTGIDINNSGGHTIVNNDISDNRTGLIFRNQTDNINFTNNSVTNNWTVGILFLDASNGSNVPPQQAFGSNFNNNNISGNWYGGVVDRQAGGAIPPPPTNPKNFTCNWWGTTSPVVSNANSTEPGYGNNVDGTSRIPVTYGGTATNPGGSPDIAGPGSANIIYQPYLTSGGDADNNPNTGFQPTGTCSGTSADQDGDGIPDAQDNCPTVSTLGLNHGLAYNGTDPQGSQAWTGRLGLVFTATQPVTITRLGAYDDNQDGLMLPIQVGIVNSAGATVVGPVTLSGSGDPLVNLFRMRSIAPIVLPPGQYTVVAVGYGSTEHNGNSSAGDLPVATNPGAGQLTFDGASYDGNTTFGQPSTPYPDPVVFHAGTFEFAAPADQTDTDGDGQGDACDPDDDNDGTSDADEIACGSDPLVAASTCEVCDGVDNDGNDGVDEGFTDTDGDTQADCVDTDDDGDGITDVDELVCGSDPLVAASTCEVCDGVDNDGNDGVDEDFTDTDGDGQKDCVDADDDGDGITDVDELACGSDPLVAASTCEVCDGVDNDGNEGVDEGFTDTNGDGQADCVDTDDDGDGTPDHLDCAPLDPNNNDYIMCHQGKTKCVKAKDFQKNLDKKDDKWTAGPCTQGNCKNDETLMCKDGQTECVKNKQVQKNQEKGWTVGPCSSNGNENNQSQVSADQIQISETLDEELRTIDNIKVSPNPTRGLITLQLENRQMAQGEIVIIDIKGRIIERRAIGANSPQTQRFNLDKQATGMYFIKVVTANGVKTAKVIIQR